MSSYRSYVPWSKTNLSSSYGSSNTYSKPESSTPSSQYDSSYRRYRSGSASSGIASNYRSTYTLPRDRSNTRNETSTASARTSGSTSNSENSYLKDNDEKSNNSLIDKYSTSSIKDNESSKYSTKEPERKSIRDKYLSSSSYTSRDNSRNYLSSNQEKKEDPPPPPVSYTTRSLSRSGIRSRDPSPDIERTSSTSSYSSSLSPFRLYSRQHSFTRSTSRDSTVEPSSPTTPTSSHSSNSNLQRYGSSRYSSSLRSSSLHDKPSVFGVTLSTPSDRYRSRVSSVSSSSKDEKEEKPNSSATKIESPVAENIKDGSKNEEKEVSFNTLPSENSESVQKTFITVVTRGTSPTPPSNSTFLRSRRADLARVIEKTIERSTIRPETQDKEIQSDRGDDTARLSRYGGSTRFTATYLDRYPSSVSRYSRYGSTYSSTRDKEKDETTKTEQETQPTHSKMSERSVSKELEKLLSKTNDEKKNSSARINISHESAKIEKEPEIKNSVSEKSIKKEIGKSENKDSNEITKELEKILSKANEMNKSKDSDQLQNETNNNENLVNQETKKISKTPSSSRILSRKSSIKEKSGSDSDSTKVPKSPKLLSRKSSLKKTKSSVDIQASNKEPGVNNFAKKENEMDNKASSESNKFLKEQNKSDISIPKVFKTDSNKNLSNSSKNISKSSSQTSEDQKPPPVPKNDHNIKPSHSLNNNQTLNKDFRKSPLNMDQQSQKIKLSKSIAAISSAPPLIKRTSPSSESSESDSESTESSDSNSSEEEVSPSTPSLQPNELRKSATLLSSTADELSIADKPPRPPSSPKSQPKTEEAKSFLMRALAPVTNLFKAKSQESADTSSCENVSELPHSGSAASLNNKSDKEIKKIKKINRNESGERAWWLDDNPDNIPEGIQRIKSSKSITSESDRESKEKNKLVNQIKKQDSGEKASLLESNSSIKKVKSSKSITSDSDKESKKSLKIKKFKILKQESGERAWWLDSNSNIPEGIQKVKSNSSINKEQENLLKPSKKISRIESGERASWLDSGDDSSKASLKKTKSVVSFDSDVDLASKRNKKKLEGIPNSNLKKSRSKSLVPEDLSPYRIRHQQSGEQAWWLTNNGNVPEGVTKLTTSEESSESDAEVNTSSSHIPKFPLQIQEQSNKIQRKSEPNINSGRVSPYENVESKPRKRNRSNSLFIGKHTNIDDILGSAASLVTPAISRLKHKEPESEASECEEVEAKQVRIHDSTAQKPSIQRVGSASAQPPAAQLDDTALQLYKDGDYGAYLDLEASINEQQEEFEGFQSNRKNSIVLRTQLSVRVHTIIEKLLNSEGRELRRALFSLKQIFQEDKDLVHEFVQNDGLACLIKVGSEADQNYQNYILRALGQVMLYVDGMNGVIEHPRTVQWLYTLIASRFRLVVKTALKLLLVFVEYVETNCLLLIQAVQAVDQAQGLLPWANIMKLLKDFEAGDTELLIYATTLINKTLNGIPDQDTYYDQVDSLEEQGMEGTIQRYMSKQGTDLDLLRQLQIYEAVLHHEDGDEKGTPLRQLDDTIRKTLRQRKCLSDSITTERRKSRRQSTGSTPIRLTSNGHHANADGGDSSGSSRSSPGAEIHLNGSPYTDNKATSDEVGVTPALRRRRERAERQRSFIREQQELKATCQLQQSNEDDQVVDINDDENKSVQRLINGQYENGSNKPNNRKDLTPLLNAVNKLDSEAEPKSPEGNGLLKKPWVLTMINDDQMKRENTVKDLTQKLANQNPTLSPTDESKGGRIGDMTGLISKAKEGLAKSKSKAEVTKSSSAGELPKSPEPKKSETELHWEELVAKMSRPLTLCDLDFTDLRSEDETDILLPSSTSNGGPPPPPPVPNLSKLTTGGGGPPPPPPVNRCIPPPMPPNSNSYSIRSRTLDKSNTSTIKKNKKTVKLFWKEVRDDPIIMSKLNKAGMIWDELIPVTVDIQKLEHLFESRAKDLIHKKQQEMNKNKEIIVLDHKRSNAINIGMTKLPPPRSIKTAILKMDATIMNREGIEKLLTMLPTEEERSKIQDAQAANPDLPLGSAEQFLLTLASISELPARLKLWAFKLDFENTEKEIAEPLMDLKQGIETLRNNKTFRGILSTLLSIGIFLNGAEVKGFQIEYLSKVPEVKDTVHKHSLLHHLCHMVMDKFPDSTDLYSEIGAVTRASRVDFEEVSANISRMETECKASWDHLKLIAKHDGSTMMKVKMSDFLADCAERIIVLGIIHRRVMNRFHKFELWLGIPLHRINDMKPNELCRIVSEFSLEYRTTRERVLQQLEKKANHRERNKTRGKMITEVSDDESISTHLVSPSSPPPRRRFSLTTAPKVGKFRTKEDRADAELRQLLGSDMSEAESLHGTLPWRRQRKSDTSNITSHRTVLSPLIRDETSFNGGNMTDGDDEIFESLVKTATKAPSTRTAPRERKRTRHADLKRSRTREKVDCNRQSP